MSGLGGTAYIYAETRAGTLTQGALDAAAWAWRLGMTVEAVAVAPLGEEAPALLGDRGVARVHVFSDEGQSDRLPAAPVAAAMASLIGADHAALVALAPSRNGRDLAGRLAVRLNAPVVTQVENVTDGPPLILHSAIFGGGVRVATRVGADRPVIAVLAPGGHDPEPAGGLPPALLVSMPGADGGPSRRARVVHRTSPQPDPQGAPLEHAEIVVSGGRGLGNAASFGLVREVADLLGGAVGASRGAVDAGWAPDAALVGQSGRTVAPIVYIGCGISGAIQHLAGIRGARYVIAINSDPAAPLLARADLAIVGDAATVLGRLAAELRRRTRSPQRGSSPT